METVIRTIDTASEFSVQATRYSYDPSGRLADTCTTTAATCSAAPDRIQWTYDEAGNRASETTPAGTLIYVYDDADRLVEITGHSPATFTYDADGNRLTDSRTGAVYTWRQNGMMSSAVVAGVTYTFDYTGDGRRVAVTADDGASPVTEEFWWDASHPVPMLALRPADSTSVHGPGLMGLSELMRFDAAGDVRFPLEGTVGSHDVLTDDAGAVVSRPAFSPWGVPESGDPSGFAGEWADVELGQVHLRARQYDPSTGQFLSQDPAFTSTWDRYGYAPGDPLLLVDPMGLWPGEGIWDATGGRVVASVADGCVLGHTGENGACRGSRAVQMYADDVSNVAGLVSTGCAVSAVVAAPTGVGAAAFTSCAFVADHVSITASVLHTLVTCNGGVDGYCTRSLTATAINGASVYSGNRLMRHVDELGVSDGDEALRWADAFGIANLPLVGAGLSPDTQERPC